MGSKLISIIVPNYNNEQYLDVCLESIQNQSFKNIQIIVVDDCSSDDSVQLVEQKKLTDERIFLVRNEKNQGVNKTRNIGFKHADGEILTTLDSDDIYINETKLEKEYDVLKRHNFENDIISFSGVIKIDQQGEVVPFKRKRKHIKEGDLFKELLTRDCFIPRDFLFSRNQLSKVEGYNVDLPIYEDWDFKIRLSRHAKFLYSGIEGIGYRQSGAGLSSVDKKTHQYWLNYIFELNSEGLSDYTSLAAKLRRNTGQVASLSLMNRIIGLFRKL